MERLDAASQGIHVVTTATAMEKPNTDSAEMHYTWLVMHHVPPIEPPLQPQLHHSSPSF